MAETLENPFAQGPSKVDAPVPNQDAGDNPFAAARPINLTEAIQETPPHEAAYNAIGRASGAVDLAAEGVGGAAGVALASATGMSGIGGAALGAGFAGVGASLAGYLGDRLKEAYKIEDPVKRSEAEKLAWRFVGGIVGETAARGAISVAARFARTKAEREMISSLGERAKDFELESARAVQNAGQEFGVSVRFDQLFPNSPEAITVAERLAKKYPEMSTYQIAQNLEVLDAFDNLTAQLGKSANPKKVSDFATAIAKDYETTIFGLQQEAIRMSGGRTYINEGKSVLDVFRAELSASGVNFKGDLPVGPFPEGTQGVIAKYIDIKNKISRDVAESGLGQKGGLVPKPGEPLKVQTTASNPYDLLPPAEAGEASAGLTLGYIEQTRKFLQEAANFDKKAEMGISQGEAAARRIYKQVVGLRDDINLKVFDERGAKGLADELRFYRDMNTQQRNALEKVQNQLASKPANEWRTLIDPNRPDLVENLWSILPESLKKEAPGMFLDNIGDPFIVHAKPGQKPAFGAKAVSEAWGKIDQNVKNTIYTKDQQKTIEQFFGLARAIESRQIPVEKLEQNGLVSRLVSLFFSPKAEGIRMADRMTARMFVKNPQIKEFLDARRALLTPASTAGEAQARAAKSQALSDAVMKFKMGVPVSLPGVAGAITQGAATAAPGAILRGLQGQGTANTN